MSVLAIPENCLPPATEEMRARISEVEQAIRKREQIQVQTEHILHAGMYARTVRLAANVVIVSVLIKVPTMLTVHGHCHVFAGDKWYELKGYNVMPTSPGRKNIYVTHTETEITMVFPSKAQTKEEAEAQFTDEVDDLLSRQQDEHDLVWITGVEPCQA